VCPFNRFAPESVELALRPGYLDAAAPPLLTLLALDEETFARRFALSPIKRIGHARLLRNACVAAGNWGSEEAVPGLIPLLAAASPLVRGHAAWALGQIGGSAARRALNDALAEERHVDVREEVQAALAGEDAASGAPDR
jgi:epoxyqueuosine reductase